MVNRWIYELGKNCKKSNIVIALWLDTINEINI